MSRGINVKIATVKVIKGLETSLAKMKKDYAEQEKNEAAFQKKHDAWEKKAEKTLLENLKLATQTDVGIWRGSANLTFRFHDSDKLIELIGKEPERDYQVMGDYEFKSAVEEIENAIRLLKLTDEEFVSTSTYKSVAKYI